MGNLISKKSRLSNYHEMYSSRKSLFENKIYYDEREHLSHLILREISKGNFSSPIQDILKDSNAKILDVGCGSGFWLMEMAADFKNPSFVGIDKLPIFPESTFPSNVKFLQHNFLDGLPYEDGTFDYISMRGLAIEFTESQWENFVYQELARVLKPGGWLEICDSESEYTNGGPISKQLALAVNNYLITKHVNPHITKRHHSLLKSIPSFSSSTVRHEKHPFPLNSSAGKMGKLGGLQFKEFCRYSLRLVGRDMNVKRKHINLTADKILGEFESYKSYIYFHSFYVQKSQT